MTCLEMLKKEHPDIWEHHRKLTCPSMFGYANDPEWCNPSLGRCENCWNRDCSIPSPDATPNPKAPKFKIFFGTHWSMSSNPADAQVNAWLVENPNVKILDVQYQESDDSHHSICIMYEEVKAE